jgi:uncharacterized protein DUF4169
VGKVVNLNKFRKRKVKAADEKQAEVNRRLHGRTKAERAREELQKKQLTRAVDGAKRTPPQPVSDPEVSNDVEDGPSRSD